MSPLQFQEIPLDVKKAVLSYITRPEDLKNLCLTCKLLREIAIPLLYRRMLLFIGGQKDLRISAMLGRDNPGIPHIRNIYLKFEKNFQPPKQNADDSSDEESTPVVEEEESLAIRQAQFTVRLLLDFLPPNILEVFSWQDWEPLSVDNWLLLCKKQKRLQAVEIGSMDRPLAPAIEKEIDLAENFRDVTILHFYPDKLDRLQACQKILQAKPGITKLYLANGFQYSGEPVPDDLHDSSTQPGLLTRTLFSHMRPFESCTPMALKYLSLDNIELRYAADTYLKIINFCTLEELQIDECVGADVVFAQLSKPHLRPSMLKTLRWLQEEINEPHALAAFEGFLESLSGLTILHVDVNHMRALPKPTALTRHKKTLLSLFIHSQSSSTAVHTYRASEFDEICTDCTELRQLSLFFPTTPVLHASAEFKTFLGYTRKLRHLTTLTIQRWPLMRESGYGKLKPQWLDIYEHQLQRLAQRIFEVSDTKAKQLGWGFGTRSALSVVAFGSNGKSIFEGSEEIKLKQIPFVRGLQVDPFGKSSLLAVRTQWRMVRYLEPESDILNHSLYDLDDVNNGP